MIEDQPAPASEDFRRTWDTSYVARKDRFSYFREGVCQAFMSFSPEAPSGRDVEARIETASLPQGLLSKIDVTPHRATRSRQDISSIPGEYLSLGIQLTGGLEGVLDGKTFAQRTGDVTLVQANKISDLALDRRQRYATTQVLFARPLLGNISNLPNLHLVGRTYHQAIKSCLSLINDRYNIASKPEMINLFDGALALVTASLINDIDYLEDRCSAEGATQNGILQTIKKFVGEQISDPALSTNTVADHFGISARYVQKLFASEGKTFKTHMTEMRLDRVRSDLQDRSLAHVPIGDIAFRWGFRDLTTFHRNFKVRCGDTPGQTRIMMLEMKAERRGALDGLSTNLP